MMENVKKYWFPFTLVGLIVVGWYLFFSGETKETKKFETKQGELGAVMVEVTPKSPGEYAVSFNTHSVVLDFDFTKIIKLTDDKGNIYSPVSWSGGKGGHHISGTITFPNITKEAKTLTLTISNVDNKSINFTWEI